jgi:hypothetical protein
MKRFALLVFLFALSASEPAAQCVLPAAPEPGVSDTEFDGLFTQNGPGWTGADGTFSILLPDGRNLWLWSDTFIGTVDPATRRRESYFFTAHNSLTIHDPSNGTLTTVSYPPKTTSYLAPKRRSNWFWMGDPIAVEVAPGVQKLKVMLTEWTGFYQFQGNSVATLSLPSLTIDSVQRIATEDLSIWWGAKLFKDGSYYYLYGIKDPGTANKLPYLARFSSINDLTRPTRWRFWNATSGTWVVGQANATPLAGVPAITGDYTVHKLQATTGPFYLMVGMDPANPPYPGWENVTTYYACAPEGPWTQRTIVYTTPETGAPGCKTGTTLTYNPRAHPEYAQGEDVLVSYNVNASVGQDLVCADDYRPRFLRVRIPGLLP